MDPNDSTRSDAPTPLLSAEMAAERLGLAVSTLYEWLGKSDAGELVIRSQPVSIEYLQGGANGQGRIRIEADEVERILQLMRVAPSPRPTRRPPSSRHPNLPHIHVRLGRPDDGQQI